MSAAGAAADITFEPDTHSYWHGMAQVPAVSEVMRPLTEQYLRTIPEDILNWKRDLGIAVHKACELHDLRTLDEDGLDGQIVPYLEGYKQFLVDYRPEWAAIETIVFDRQSWYAGTLDRAGTVGRFPTIVDIKTSRDVASYAGIQLFAYAMAYDAFEAPDLAVLQLLPSGEYKLHHFTDYQRYSEAWNGLLALHRWRKENQK